MGLFAIPLSLPFPLPPPLPSFLLPLPPFFPSWSTCSLAVLSPCPVSKEGPEDAVPLAHHVCALSSRRTDITHPAGPWSRSRHPEQKGKASPMCHSWDGFLGGPRSQGMLRATSSHTIPGVEREIDTAAASD